MGRVLIILPILSAFTKKIGYEKGSREEEGIILIGILSTYLPAFAILPANVPNNVLLGSMQSLYNIHFTYISYFLDFFIVLGLGKLIIIYILFLILYRNCKPPLNIAERKNLKMNSQQKKASFLLLITMILWITEKWHGISVGWVGMIASIICALPGSGLLMKKPLRSIGFESFFYIAGIVSLGNIARHTEIATKVSNYFIEQFSIASMGQYRVSILWIVLGIIIGLIVTVPGIPAILTPLAINFSEMTSLSIETLCKLQVLSFSNIFFPYQAPPLVVALQETGVSKVKTTGICITISIINLLIFSNILLYIWKVI
jgi:conserved integral membrane protein